MADGCPAIHDPQIALGDGCDRPNAGDVEKVAGILILDRHPATIYRWIDSYNRSERLSALLRKGSVRSGQEPTFK
jgi:hypothetical protein